MRNYVEPSTLIPKILLVNCYTAFYFLWVLLSLIVECGDDLEHKLMGKEVQMFSYGSGTVASLHCLKVGNNENAKELLQRMVSNNDVDKRLQERTKIGCEQYTEIMNRKEAQFHDVEERSNL
eukprot:TRINITY_DN16772_c0_g1_i1.p1 TRINITY_DN16772_c0_g1~~TRINITY_DN16772_c0_g1_i1.p1  ORF type:complete len:122 (-),score=5.54 TRINITY_DN16772_c0_g1_i1:10-375(-)